MKNTQNIIGQHYNSVAQSFLKYGYTGPVNQETLQAMADFHGTPFLQTLAHAISNESRYDGTLRVNPYFDDYAAGNDFGMITDPNQGGNSYVYDIDPLPLPPVKQPPLPPEDYYPLPPVKGPGFVPMFLGPPIKMPPIIAVTSDYPPSMTGNGGMLNQPQEVQTFLPTQNNPAMSATDTEEKTFWEKYSTAIIIVIVVAAFIFMSRRSAPVIIK